MKEAYQLGLSTVEVKEFIYSSQKEPIPKWFRPFLVFIKYIMLTKDIYIIYSVKREETTSVFR